MVPMGVGQTFIRMLGYVTKDRGQPHHAFLSHGVSDDDIAIGQAEWESLKLHYMDGKVALNKTNLFARAHTFYNNHVSPDVTSFSETIAKMLNTRKYMITASLLMNSNGQMRCDSAENYWSLISGADDVVCSAELVESLLYLPLFAPRRPPLSQPPVVLSRPAVRVPLADYEPLDGSGAEPPSPAPAPAPAPAAAGGSGRPPPVPIDAGDSDDGLESTPRAKRPCYKVIQETISRARRTGALFIADEAAASDAGDEDVADEMDAFDAAFIDDRDEDDLSVASP